MFARRRFLQAAALAPVVPVAKKPTGGPLLNAYYFRAHMYTIVPRHVREDMKWMAGLGTKVVSLAVLEQDFTAARENIELVANEAARAGMDVWAVPSRWAGMVAGAPKVPSSFCVKHPHTWLLNKEGKPARGVSGVMSSVHYPETLEFFKSAVTELLTRLPFKGIIWDEPKTLTTEDFSPAALKKKPPQADRSWHTDAVAAFYEQVNTHAKSVKPDVALSMFIYAQSPQTLIERCARIGGLDYFGCDGRPWAKEDGGTLEGGDKVLVGKAEAFIQAARANGKKGLVLVENHNLKAADIPLMDKRLPQVLGMGAEQLIYYYYPRNVEEPDRAMAVLRRHLRRR